MWFFYGNMITFHLFQPPDMSMLPVKVLRLADGFTTNMQFFAKDGLNW